MEDDEPFDWDLAAAEGQSNLSHRQPRKYSLGTRCKHSPFLCSSTDKVVLSLTGNSTISMPNTARSCFCAPSKTCLNDLPCAPKTNTSVSALRFMAILDRSKLVMTLTLVSDAFSAYRGPRILAGESIPNELLYQLRLDGPVALGPTGFLTGTFAVLVPRATSALRGTIVLIIDFFVGLDGC